MIYTLYTILYLVLFTINFITVTSLSPSLQIIHLVDVRCDKSKEQGCNKPAIDKKVFM